MGVDVIDIKRAVNDWLPIIYGMGVPELPTKKEGACLFCGGKTRARWIPDKQYYFCNRCDLRGRDGVSVIQEYNGWTFVQTIKELADYLGLSDKPVSQYRKRKYQLQQEKNRYMKAAQYFLCGMGSIERNRLLTPKEWGYIEKAINIIREYELNHSNHMGVIYG